MLFKSLLAYPAILGILVPSNAFASELNIEEINIYAPKKLSSKREIDNKTFSNDLTTHETIFESEIDPINEFEAGSFSTTTTMSGSASFTIGAIDKDEIYDPNQTEQITAHYSYDIDLNTSFDGDDNLYIGLVAGNANGTGIFLDNSNIVSTEDVLTVESLFYSFPLGAWDVAVGPKLDSEDLVATTISEYSDSFYLGGIYPTNVYTLPGLTGTGIAIARDFENGFNVGGILLSLEASSSDGMFTNEGADTKTIMAGYDGKNFGGGIIYTEFDDVWSVGDYTSQNYLNSFGVSKLKLVTTSIGGYWRATEKLTTNLSTHIINPNIGRHADNFNDVVLSMDYGFNENNILSAAYRGVSFLNTDGEADFLGDIFEIYYTRNVSDSLTFRGGVEIQNPSTDQGNGTTTLNGGTGDDFVLFDQKVFALEATFKF